MKQAIGYIALVVEDYDEAIRFYVETLGFRLVEDTFVPAQQKRWVLVAPPGSSKTKLLLARAVGDEQVSRVGNQTGGRVFLFLHTDDFWRGLPGLSKSGRRLRASAIRRGLRHGRGLQGSLWESLGLAPIEPVVINQSPRSSALFPGCDICGRVTRPPKPIPKRPRGFQP